MDTARGLELAEGSRQLQKPSCLLPIPAPLPKKLCVFRQVTLLFWALASLSVNAEGSPVQNP